jgi:hypothetical protein
MYINRHVIFGQSTFELIPLLEKRHCAFFSIDDMQIVDVRIIFHDLRTMLGNDHINSCFRPSITEHPDHGCEQYDIAEGSESDYAD